MSSSLYTDSSQSTINSRNVPPLSDDEHSCILKHCSLCKICKKRGSEVYLPSESNELPEIVIQEATPEISPIKEPHRLDEYRNYQIYLERSLDPSRGSTSNGRPRLSLLQVPYDDDYLSALPRVNHGSSYGNAFQENRNNRRPFNGSLRRRARSESSLARARCPCMANMSIIDENSELNFPTTNRHAAITQRSWSFNRVPHPMNNVFSPSSSPILSNSVAISNLPAWAPNIVYGWLVYVCSQFYGFREVFVCNENFAYAEFATEMQARNASIHLNGYTLTSSDTLCATYTQSHCDDPFANHEYMILYAPNPNVNTNVNNEFYGETRV